MVFPTILGGGKRLFADGSDPRPLTLARTRQTGTVAILELERPASA